MKKISLGILLLLSLVACSSTVKKEDIVTKYNITKESMLVWDETMGIVLSKESLIGEWHRNDHPIMYLRGQGKIKEEEVAFLQSLSGKKVSEISNKEYEEYTNLIAKYASMLPRKFYLKDHNIKDSKALVDFMIKESQRANTVSNHIKNKVATQEEWNSVIAMSKKNIPTQEDVTTLRKMFNRMLKENNLFVAEIWISREVSDKMITLVTLSKRSELSPLELNNLNAAALSIAYKDYFSKLENWDK